MRITDNIINDNLQSNNATNRDKYLYKMLQVSSGQKYIRRSDDPTATAQLARATAKQKQNLQWGENAAVATGFCQMTDSTMADLVARMQGLNERLVSANDQTKPPEYLKGISNEINQILEALYQISNSKDANGVYLFGGTNTASPPFDATRDANGNIIAVVYNGNPTDRRRIQNGDDPNIDTVSYGLLGGGASGVFIASGSAPPVDVMQNLIELRDTMATGANPTTTQLEAANRNLEHVIQKYVDNGVTLKSIVSFSEKVALNDEYMNKVLSLGDIDMAAAISEMSQMQAAYQASLSVTGKLYSLSILNYI